LLSAATIASLDPEIDDEDLPRVNVDQALAFVKLKCGEGGAGRRRRPVKPERPIEEVRANILRKLDAIEAHEKKRKAGAKKGAKKEAGPSDG